LTGITALANQSAPASASPSKPKQRFVDSVRFLKTWLGNPQLLGAVMPSGAALAKAIAHAVDPAKPGPIIELGPGTGVVTEALLARGIAPNRLILVEFEPSFCALLADRFPGVRIVQGDAYRLKTTLGQRLDPPPVAVVSSLPLLMKPEPMRIALLAEAFDLMAPGAIFVQFTYGLTSPIPRTAPLVFKVESSPRIWLNVPPARVWVYRRLGDAAPRSTR
jgi:phosphatidylethanolamine/phosphatidyl-N-methylethanolamine N-methyltransferase